MDSDKLHEELMSHITEFELHKQSNEEMFQRLVEAMERIEAKLDPIHETFTNATGFGRTVKWFIYGAIALGSLIIALREIYTIFKK